MHSCFVSSVAVIHVNSALNNGRFVRTELATK